MQWGLWTLEGGLISLIFAALMGAVGFFVSARKNTQLSAANGRLEERLTAQQDSLQQLEQRLQEAQQQQQQAVTKWQASDALQHQKNSQLEVALASQQSLQGQLQEAKEKIAQQEQQQHELQQRYQSLATEHAELNTNLSSKEEHFKEQFTQLQDAKKQLAQEFENIANKVFEEKNKTFTETSKTNIDQLLKPFREQIDAFQKRTNDVHDAALKGQAQLEAEIKKVMDVGMRMGEDAKNLTTALKGDSQQRGAWGEAQLERTLQISGLLKNDHYEAQTSFTDEQGRTKRTDYIIKLPDGKNLIIDSKVTLNAYSRVVEAESTEDYNRAMKEHCDAVRRHIDDLKSKDYSSLAGIRSPDYVLMFMPIEAAYIEALKHDDDLFEYGYNRDVILVSHTTLIPILRTVANLWRLDRSTKESQELSQRAGDIYKQVSLVAERLDALGKTLSTATGHYNRTVTAMVGQQGLYGKVERFNTLSQSVSKDLPALEPKHFEIENQKLALAIEPVTMLEPAEEEEPES